jgi:SAM-dependent methyltransferase
MSVAEFAPAQGDTLERMAGAPRYNAWLLERAMPFLGPRVLDVGAGIGTFSHALAAGREVVALEPDPRLLPVLRRRFAGRANVTVRPGRIEDLGREQTFDAILCLNVLEHVGDDEAAIERFAELLAPGGRVLLLVPAHPVLYGPLDHALHHERRYRRDELRRLLASAGLVPELVRFVNPVGALGWLVSGRALRRDDVPVAPLRLFDRLVPLLRMLDRVSLPFGLSLWAVARRP